MSEQEEEQEVHIVLISNEPGVEFEDVIGFLTAALPASKKDGIVLFI
jgi:hypothetical protein